MKRTDIFTKTRGTARIVRALLWANVVAAILTFFFDTRLYVMASRQAEAPTGFGVLGLETGLFLLADGLLFAGTAIFFLVWMYGAHQSATELNTTFIERSSAGAVYWWFVPVASLWMPAKIMVEIYEAGARRVRRGPGVATIWTWWFCWMGFGVTYQVHRAGFMSAGVDSPVFVASSAIAATVEIAAAYFAVRVLDEVTDLHSQAWRQKRRFGLRE